jgi:hypothetical protein
MEEWRARRGESDPDAPEPAVLARANQEVAWKSSDAWLDQREAILGCPCARDGLERARVGTRTDRLRRGSNKRM